MVLGTKKVTPLAGLIGAGHFYLLDFRKDSLLLQEFNQNTRDRSWAEGILDLLTTEDITEFLHNLPRGGFSLKFNKLLCFFTPPTPIARGYYNVNENAKQ